jgi:secondary thiamine-phosphate synthase enzyme
METLKINTQGEGFYEITDKLKALAATASSEILTIFCPHTSCALTINEAYDPSASEDMVAFLKHLAPRNLHFIKHTLEGPDDSPSHMKAMLLQHSLQLIVENGKLIIGQWQGIFLAEFRDKPHERSVYLKMLS